jgi:hypothetical protein
VSSSDRELEGECPGLEDRESEWLSISIEVASAESTIYAIELQIQKDEDLFLYFNYSDHQSGYLTEKWGTHFYWLKIVCVHRILQGTEGSIAITLLLVQSFSGDATRTCHIYGKLHYISTVSHFTLQLVNLAF